MSENTMWPPGYVPARREKRVRVPGYVGTEVAFERAEDVFARFPYGPPEHSDVIRAARVWLTRGVDKLMGSTEPHCLIVEAGP